MDLVKEFIKFLFDLDLSCDIRKAADNMYNELETLDVDLEEKQIMRNKMLPYDLRVKIVDLIEFYYLKADDCINIYTDKEAYDFLRQLKTKAEEIYPQIMDIE